jgi:hypothetical protein
MPSASFSQVLFVIPQLVLFSWQVMRVVLFKDLMGLPHWDLIKSLKRKGRKGKDTFVYISE